MSAKQRLEKVKRLTARINAEVIRAIALQSMWARCAENLAVVNALREELWFPIVRDTFHIDLLMTLCRLHEHGHAENATISVALSIIEDPPVRALLVSQETANEAMAQYGRLQKSGVVRRLRVFRDRVLAHNDMRKTDITAAYGDETMLLDESAQIASDLHMAVAGSRPQFDLYRTAWVLVSDEFWARVLAGGAGQAKSGVRE